MTTFTITTDTNINALVGKTSNDTYNVNGAKLTQDSDTRYGFNQNTASILGTVSLSANLGGDLLITSKNIKLIQYTNGSGNVPAAGSIINQGTNTAEVICVMSDSWGNVIKTPGSSLGPTGWIKVKNVSAVFTSGAFTSGISGVVSDYKENAWMMVVGTDSKQFTVPRLGSSVFRGNWYEIGSTNGLRGQTFQLPFITAEQIIQYPGVEIETSIGSGVYQFWHNAGDKFRSDTQSTDKRSEHVYISLTGILTIGTGLDNQPTGFMPLAGCKVRIPGIILQYALSSNPAVNTISNANTNVRYKSSTSAAGVMDVELTTGNWWFTLMQPYSVRLRDVHICDQITIAESASKPDIDRLHVGISTGPNFVANSGILIQQCYNGGTVGEMSSLRAEGTSSSGYSLNLTNLYGGWTFKKLTVKYASNCTTVSGCAILNTCDSVLIEEFWGIGKRFVIFGSSKIKVLTCYKADNLSGSTNNTAVSKAIETSQQCRDIEIYGIQNYPGVQNSHPRDGLISCSSTINGKFRLVGSASSPYFAGDIPGTLMRYQYIDYGNNSDIKIQRIWTTGLDVGMISSTNSSTSVAMENCYMTDASKTTTPQVLNGIFRGNKGNAGTISYSYTSVYGSIFTDWFISDVTARAQINMIEKSASTGSHYQITSGSPKFTAQGELVMGVLNDQIVWTWPYYILGWNALTDWVISGTNQLTNHLYEYDLDRGVGFTGLYKILTPGNLAAEINLSPTSGFKFKIKITCIKTDAANKIRAFAITGTTSLTLQNTALYPLDTALLKLTNIIPGSTVSVFNENLLDGDIELAHAVSISSVLNLQFDYDITKLRYVLRIRKPGYTPVELLIDNNLIINVPVSQELNKDGFGRPIYGRGTFGTKSYVTIDSLASRIDIGNIKCKAEDVYDTVAEWQSTRIGMRSKEALRFDGTDMLLRNTWLFRRKLPSYTTAGIDAVPVVESNNDNSPDDEINGSIDFRARSVRTYSFNPQPIYTIDDIKIAVADAVWKYPLNNTMSTGDNLLSTKQAAENSFAVGVMNGSGA
jgi:hypothetical protein